jgi:apolipoprotein N-acyltransferase
MAERWSFAAMLGLVGGAMLFLPTVYDMLAPLQLIAWTPFLVAISRSRVRHLPVAGACMAIGYVCPQCIVNMMPQLVSIALLLHIGLLLVVISVIARALMSRPSALGALAVGALVAAMDWANFSVVPIWGAAQSWARPWSAYPVFVQFVSLTGLATVSFVVVSLQALFLCAARDKTSFARCAIAGSVLVAAVAACNAFLYTADHDRTVRVAAVGWYSRKATALICLEKSAADAASQGAVLLVSPEAGFCYRGGDFDGWCKPFRDLALKHRLYLVAGYLDDPANKNRLMIVGPDGELMAQYTKTHLVILEPFEPGDGNPVTIDANGIRVGGVICHDDNFTGLTRRHGRIPVALLAVPTLDWKAVMRPHFQSSRWRAIESQMSVVRGAINGISAIIGPRGEIIATRNHFTEGSGVIVGDIPIDPRVTVFDRYGHWPVPVFVSFVLATLIARMARSRRKKITSP